MKSLLIGCGRKRDRIVRPDGSEGWGELTTLDINPEHEPDILWDLNELPLPFEDESFDEIHAYEVLEHTGRQGDWAFFFHQFSEFYRILKPGGVFAGSSPRWDQMWAWGDPGHTRVIQPQSFTFLSQAEYTAQIGVTPMTDYRFVYRADFEVMLIEPKDYNFYYALQAIKPSRIAGNH